MAGSVTVTYRPEPGGWADFVNGSEYRAWLTRLGNRVVNNAKGRCPVDTGNLRSSIRLDLLSNGEAEVSANTEYAGYVHDGTRYVPARPFLRDALTEEVGRL
jgi:HK97 gp10 family phage protein